MTFFIVRPPNNPDQTPTGQHPVKQSISEALKSAQPGDTIALCPGVYEVQLNITKNVQLQPFIAPHTVPDASLVRIVSKKTLAIRVSGEVRVSIQHITLDQTAPYTPSEPAPGDDTVAAMRKTPVCVRVLDRGVFTASHCVFRTSHIGAMAMGGKLELVDCMLSPHSTATVARETSGVVVLGSSDVIMKNCSLKSFTGHSIRAMESATLKIVGGRVDGCDRTAVRVTEFARVSLEGVSVLNCACAVTIQGRGLETEQCTVALTNCSFQNLRNTGIFVMGQVKVKVVGGAIVGCQRCGLCANDSAEVDVESLTIRDSSDAGVYIYGKAKATLNQVKCIARNQAYIVRESGSLSLKGCTASGCRDPAVVGEDAVLTCNEVVIEDVEESSSGKSRALCWDAETGALTPDSGMV